MAAVATYREINNGGIVAKVYDVDKNGVTMKHGDVVEITGGYFKRDNGLWVIAHAPGDEGWYGGYCLHRLNKNGTPSKSKNNIEFWPLTACVSNHRKTLEARAHNAEHAQIEVITPATTSAELTKDEPKEEPAAEENAPVHPAEQAQESAETAVETATAEIIAEQPAEAPEVVYTIDDIGHDIAVKRIGDDLYSVEFREDGKRLGTPENHSAETIDFCYGVDVNAVSEAQTDPTPAETIPESAGDTPEEAPQTAEPTPRTRQAVSDPRRPRTPRT